MTTRRWRAFYALALTIGVIFSAPPVQAKTTLKDEIEIGRKAAKEIEKEFPVTSDKEWLSDIEQLGKLLTPNVKRKEIPYTFKVIKEQQNGRNEIDAFSLPGGPVYISERMWRLLTRDERLGVLAHEIAHVDKRHAIDTVSEMNRRSMWAAAVLIITGAHSRSIWDAADIANTLYTLKFSRKREREADMMAVDLCKAAGLSPTGLVTAMKKILYIEQHTGGAPPKILSTHPQTKDRIAYLSSRCLELGVKPGELERNLRVTDQPDRLGDVVSKAKEGLVITVSTTRDLAKNELVWVKKPLWDDASDVVIPKPVAKGVALTPGKKAKVSVTMEPGFEYIDIEQGDGVYPRSTGLAPPPPPSAPDKGAAPTQPKPG